MRIAVLSLCRDRLPYTKVAFASLRENAGCDYRHFVLDQGSTDGTPEWLEEQALRTVRGKRPQYFYLSDVNLGCCRGFNFLLDQIGRTSDYDVIVTFDNDCEVTMSGTLKVAAEAAMGGAIAAPRILGLRFPPATGEAFESGGHRMWETSILGNIFMAIPAQVFDEFRFPKNTPVWGGSENVTTWWRDRGGRCGYLDGWTSNHYLTTEGQAADIPEYFARRVREGGPAK